MLLLGNQVPSPGETNRIGKFFAERAVVPVLKWEIASKACKFKQIRHLLESCLPDNLSAGVTNDFGSHIRFGFVPYHRWHFSASCSMIFSIWVFAFSSPPATYTRRNLNGAIALITWDAKATSTGAFFPIPGKIIIW